ncbi:hypothetical protein [Actinoplanes sp. URMC 104]|uniref:hypothetical protein n=1 Tax=Actinoplanes sp. URMC 104 TaxID=3423409 RepID=UPI003F1E3010
MTRQLRLTPVEPGDAAGPAGAAFDLLTGALGVRAFETHAAIVTEPEPPWLGRVYPGRRLDVATARRLFLDMLAGRGVVCVLAGEPSLRLETSWDGVFYASVPPDRADLEGELRRLGLRVAEAPADEEPEEPGPGADDAFWAAVPFPALILECWAGGVLGQRWIRAESDAVRSHVRPRSTVAAYPGVPVHRAGREGLREAVASMDRLLDSVVVFPAGADTAVLPSRTYTAGIKDVPDDDLPPYGDLAFFFFPEEEVPSAVVPDADGVVRAPLSC